MADTIKIEIVGNITFTPRWETLEKMIKEMHHPDGDFPGRLVRIKRDDNGSNYRGPGNYNVTFRRYDPEETEIQIELIVKTPEPEPRDYYFDHHPDAA